MATEPDRLPVPLAQLPRLLSRELDPARPRHLLVSAAGLEPGHRLVLIVDAGTRRQRWEVEYTVPGADLELLDATSFVLTVRANLEEWWDTGQVDTPALRARRRPSRA